jgi:hypothetical protein
VLTIPTTTRTAPAIIAFVATSATYVGRTAGSETPAGVGDRPMRS